MAKKKAKKEKEVFYFTSGHEDIEEALDDMHGTFHTNLTNAESELDAENDFDDDDARMYIHGIEVVATYRYKRVAEYSVEQE